jgi:acyl-CoA synthetase (NDP forming)
VEKPVMVIANMTTTVDPAQAIHLRESGVPVLEGTETALRAVRHLFSHRDGATGSSPRLTTPREVELPEDEAAALALLASYGIATPETRRAGDVLAAVGAADSIGYPVVVKTTGVAHKSDVQGVRTGLVQASAVAEAYNDISARLGPAVLVARQSPPGVEIALGMVRDPGFGPVVIVGAGGELVEVLGGRIALLPPVGVEEAAAAVDRLPVRALLSGQRGAPAADLGALAEAIARFSELVLDLPSECTAVDVNPLIAGEKGSVAVDALFVGARS